MPLGTLLSPLAQFPAALPWWAQPRCSPRLLSRQLSLRPFGLGWLGPAQRWMWGFAEHPVMRKTSIPAGHRARQRVITVLSCAGCQRHPGQRRVWGSGGGEPALTASPSCPLAWGAGQEGHSGSRWVLAGSEEMQSGPSSAWHHCILVMVGQELAWPHAETIAQYWTAPLGHLGIVTWVKWAIRSARSHPWLCHGSSISLSFQASVCPSVG